MIVYSSTKESFGKEVDSGVIEEKIEYKVREKLNRGVGKNEKDSWKNSLFYMNHVLQDDGIPKNAGVCIEMQIPQTSKRIDFIITGKDETQKENAIIIELKQWETAERTNLDGIVRTFLGRGIRETNHPSYQAFTYEALLTDFNEAIHVGKINLSSCAFLHNYTPNGVLDDTFYDKYVSTSPVFMKTGINDLRSYIKSFIKYGDDSEIILKIENGKIRPSKMLSDSLVSMLDGNEEFLMIDDQKLAFEFVNDAIKNTKSENKKVIIIEGGPGTGKSVVAINLLVRLIENELFVSYVTKNSAPRTVYSSLLTGSMTRGRINNLFKSSGSFIGTLSNTFDGLIIDEAHRLNEKSGMYRNNGENQIKELINAARVSVFFIDEDQKVHIHDIGTKEEIRKWASHHNAEIIETDLASQFRCNGSDGYLAWLNNTLEIKETANIKLNKSEFDFRVFDSPNDLFSIIAEKNKENNKSRMVAGYCWDWKSKKEKTAMDIEFPEYGFSKQWNMSDDGMLWLIKEGSIDQIGCIHTCQGLELDYVGVIIGGDLVIRDGEVITDVFQRSSNDRTIFGIKKMLREKPEEAKVLADSIIKNTYKTLMTRGMKGCYVFCEDEETREYFKSRLII